MDIVGGGAPETLQTAGGWLWGSAIGEAQWPIGPQMMGRGMPPPPVGLRWISTSRADERAKQRAADCHVLRETNIG